MTTKETPEERKKRLIAQLARGRETAKKRREAGRVVPQKALEVYVRPPKRPKNLDKIVRAILDDDELVDKVIANQPEYWGRLPAKNGAYIIATVMMVKAMGGDIKAADWIRKTGYGDRVLLETDNGFFQKSDFTIQVIPTKHTDSLDPGIKAADVLESEIQQVDQTGPSVS